MGQNPSKPPGNGHQHSHSHSHSRGRSSTANTPSQQGTPTGVSRTTSQAKRDVKGAAPATSRSVAVPPSESLVSATATPQRIPHRPAGGSTPSSATGGMSPAQAMAAVVASSPRNVESPAGKARTQAWSEDVAALQQPGLPARSSPMPAAPRARSPSPPADERPGSERPGSLQQASGFDYRPSGMSGISRPPRLPLPVGEEVHTPGSPILSPTDLRTSVPDSEMDEDEPTSEMGMYQLDSGGAITVPTLIEWRDPGEKVFVTGTFTGWSKKFKLLPDPDRNSLSAIIQLPPGTHHVKFIVDGEMQTAKHLPVAVDFTNILLNYIEVSADDKPATRSSATKMSAPGQQAQQKPVPTPQQSQTSSQQQPVAVPPASQKPVVGQSTPQGTPEQIPGAPPKLTLSGPARPRKFDTNIPNYLRGLESSDNLSANLSQGGYDIPDLSKDTPAPSLPIMLSKVILNSSTPLKDDSSVLNIPNHVVLNHLATSSIRYGCLASSGTTRYKRKYVTTIMYKPLREDSSESSAGVSGSGSAVPQPSATAQAAS